MNKEIIYFCFNCQEGKREFGECCGEDMSLAHVAKENQFDKFCLETAEEAFADKEPKKPSEVIYEAKERCIASSPVGTYNVLEYLNALQAANPTLVWPEEL
jgi:hypothetical protein